MLISISAPCIIKFKFLYPFSVTKPGLVFCYLHCICCFPQLRLPSNHSAAPVPVFPLFSFLAREEQTYCTWSIKSRFQLPEHKTFRNLKYGADPTNHCSIHGPCCSFPVHENICSIVSGYELEVNTKQTHEHRMRQLLMSSFFFFSRGTSSGFNQVGGGHQCPTVKASSWEHSGTGHPVVLLMSFLPGTGTSEVSAALQAGDYLPLILGSQSFWLGRGLKQKPRSMFSAGK